MEQKEKIFVKGLIFKLPREGAPDFVKGSLSVKIDEFIQFLHDNNNNGWVNLDLKVGKSGKAYSELNTWQPKEGSRTTNPVEANNQAVPF